MVDEKDYLSEDEATRLWHRAAQLQAEAAQRAEARAAEEARDDSVAEVDTPDGYALTHVRAAALEAGIGKEFVEAALADLRAERAIPSSSRTPGRQLARRVLGGPEDAITVRRVIHTPMAQVLAAMEKVLPLEPYNLTLRDREGDPTRGGVLIFDIQGVGFSQAGQGGFKGDASWADLRQVLVTLRETDDGRACEITVRAPVAWAFGINAGFGALFSVMGGGLGLGVGSGLAAIAAGVMTSLGLAGVAAVLAATLVAGGAGGGLVAGTAGFRALYRLAMRKGAGALESMLAAVAAQAQGGWGLDAALASPDQPPALPAGDPEAG